MTASYQVKPVRARCERRWQHFTPPWTTMDLRKPGTVKLTGAGFFLDEPNNYTRRLRDDVRIRAQRPDHRDGAGRLHRDNSSPELSTVCF